MELLCTVFHPDILARGGGGGDKMAHAKNKGGGDVSCGRAEHGHS